jgi:CHAT domain-containing protein/tetratricopeptide (TPR) repeat protein
LDGAEAEAVEAITSGYRFLIAGRDDVVLAEAMLESARIALPDLRTPQERSAAHFVIGMLYQRRRPGDPADNLEHAIQHLQEALQEAGPRDGSRTTILHNLGLVYKERIEGPRADNLERAIGYLKSALASSSREADPATWATTASLLANAYNERLRGDHAGNLVRAIDLHRQVLKLRPRSEQPVEWAIAMHNLGADLLDSQLGNRAANLRAGRHYFEQALEVRTEQALPEHFALTQSMLADCLLELSEVDPQNAVADLDAALGCLNAASRVWTLEQARPRWLQIQLSRAETLARQARLAPGDDLGPAIAVLDQVLLTASPRTEAGVEAAAHGGLARLLLGRAGPGDAARAVAESEQEVAALEKSGDLGRQSQAAATLGQALAAAQRWDDAARAYQRALEAEADVGAAAMSVATEWARLRLVAGLHEAAAFAFAQSGQYRWADVLVTLERGRSRVLGDALQRDRADLAGLDRLGDRGAAAKREFSAAAETLRDLDAAQVRGGAIGGRAPSAEQLEQSQRARDQVRQARDRIRSLPGYATFMEEPGLDAITRAASPDCPMVYLFTTEHGGFAVAVYRDANDQPAILAAALSLTSGEVDQMLRPGPDPGQEGARWPGLIGVQPSGTKALDAALTAILPRIGAGIAAPLAGLLRRIGSASPAIVPCGRLAALPLAAAPLAPDVPRCLLDDFALRIAPSARVAVSSAATARGERRYVAVANPRPESAGLTWAEAEVSRVAQETKSGPPLVGRAASRDAVRAAASAADVVHLACHGVFDPEAPERSRLQLADSDLTIGEIMSSAMLRGVRLVIASACETAATDLSLPDELTGMPAAFLQAGAAAALGTLWPVNDLSASLLVSRVAAACCDPAADPAAELASAQAWLRDLSAAEAVRATRELIAAVAPGRNTDDMLDQLAWLELGGIKHPFRSPAHWAPYVLVSGPARRN